MEKNKVSGKAIDLIKKIAQLLIFLGLGILFIWLSVKDLTPDDIQTIKKSISQVNNPVSWTFLLLSLLAGASAHYFRSLRSILLIEPLHYKVRKSMSFYAVMVGYLANLAFPRLGEVLRCTFLQRYEKVPFQKALGTIVTERAIDLILWIILFFTAILLNTSMLSHLIINKEEGISLGMWIENTGKSLLTNYYLYLIIAVIVILGIVIYITRHKWGKISFFVKVKHIFVGIWQGLISIKDVKHPFLFVFYTIMIWVAYFFGTYLCFFAFDFLSGLGPMAGFAVLVFGSIGFMIAQGGLGAYPLIVAGTLVLYGIDYNEALAAGWVGWSVQTVMILIFGFGSLILASISSRKEKAESPETVS